MDSHLMGRLIVEKLQDRTINVLAAHAPTRNDEINNYMTRLSSLQLDPFCSA